MAEATQPITEFVLPNVKMEARLVTQDMNELTGNPSTWQVKWNVKLIVDERTVFECPYFTGIGHIKGPRDTFGRFSVYEANQMRKVLNGQKTPEFSAQEPELDDVMCCLVLDADVIEYANFEEWADSIGYDSDSREAEKTYRQCLEQTLKLRSAFGEDKLSELREAFIDY
jgi:hypothetical protein